MILNSLKSANSVIMDSVHSTADKNATENFIKQLGSLNVYTTQLELLLNLLDKMQSLNILSRILTQETKDSLQFAVESCGEKTDNHTLDAGTVLALKNLVELLRNTLSSAWKESSEKNCTPIIESLNSLKSLLDFPQNAEEIIKKLEVAKSSLPSSSGSLQSYINDINHGKKIIEGLNFDSDPEVKLFIDKVRRGKATVRDLTPHILEWIKDNSLSDKIRLKF